jgi:hypothetical protein
MHRCFVIEDENHAEQVGEFSSMDQVWAELARRARIPWDQPPNVAPCMSWQTCGRSYAILHYDTSKTPWEELDRFTALDVSAKGTVWSEDVP